MRKLFVPALFLFAFSASSCGEGNGHTATADAAKKETVVVNPTSNLSAANTAKLMEMMADYYQLKDALVKTDPATADKAAARMMSDAELLNHELKTDTANYAKLNPHFESIMTSTEAITNVKDETCELKRASFEKTSQAVYALLKDAGLKNGGVYQQYCPMAFDNKGAYWLSSQEEIMNPYLPKKMLHCGEVKDTL